MLELTPGRFLDRLIEPESETREALFNYIYLIYTHGSNGTVNNLGNITGLKL